MFYLRVFLLVLILEGSVKSEGTGTHTQLVMESKENANIGTEMGETVSGQLMAQAPPQQPQIEPPAMAPMEASENPGPPSLLDDESGHLHLNNSMGKLFVCVRVCVCGVCACQLCVMNSLPTSKKNVYELSHHNSCVIQFLLVSLIQREMLCHIIILIKELSMDLLKLT